MKIQILNFRGGKLIDHVQSNAAPNQRRRNKVKRRKAYYSRQRRTDIAVRKIDYIFNCKIDTLV